MISLENEVKCNLNTAEGIKLFEIFKCYNDIALFWKQENTDISISLLDGNMIIDGKSADFSELKEFIKVINPKSIFSNETILKGLGIFDVSDIVTVLKYSSYAVYDLKSDKFSSDTVYGILKDCNLELPDFKYFATDYCLRLNKGRLKVFGVLDKAVALSIGTENVLIHALASKEKGLGSICLKGIISENKGIPVLVCAAEKVKEFYIKNGFFPIYLAGYWRNNEFL